MKKARIAATIVGCVALLVLAQPAAAVVYDFDALSTGSLNGQDNWSATANYRVYNTPVTGNYSLPGNANYVSHYGGTATDTGTRPNDVNWSFDLTGQTQFAIQVAMTNDYQVSAYYGRGEFGIENTATGRHIAMGFEVLPWYYSPYIKDSFGTEWNGSTPRPTNTRNQVWDYRLEVDTTGFGGGGAGKLYIRRRDVPGAWQGPVQIGLPIDEYAVNLQLNASGMNVQASNQLRVRVGTRLAYQDNLAVIVPGSLTVKSFLDKNLNGVKDGSDEDLPGVVYSVTGPYDPIVSQVGPPVQWAYPNFGGTTDGSGEHDVETGPNASWGADDGDYTVSDTRPTFYDRAGAGTQAPTVAPGGATTAWFGYRPIIGDANIDGITDTQDFTILKAFFGQDPSLWIEANFNEDTVVDTQDFSLLKGNFGNTHGDYVPPAPEPAPEPAAMALLALGGLALLKRRRRA